MNKTRQPTWTNGEFSTRGWKRRVNRTRYFTAWNNNEAGWPQCLFRDIASAWRRPPLSLSLSLFHLVLSCSRLSALHENRENPEAWFAFCRASMGIVVVLAASRFVFRSKRATRGVRARVLQGGRNRRIEIYSTTVLSKTIIPVKTIKIWHWQSVDKSLDLDLFIYLFIFLFQS